MAQYENKEKISPKEVLDEAARYVGEKFCRIMNYCVPEDVVKEAGLRYVRETEDSALELIEHSLKYRPVEDEVGHWIHEFAEALAIKQRFGEVIPPRPDWETTPYYRYAHPIASTIEIQYLESVGAKELAEKRKREYGIT